MLPSKWTVVADLNLRVKIQSTPTTNLKRQFFDVVKTAVWHAYADEILVQIRWNAHPDQQYVFQLKSSFSTCVT